MKKIFSSILVMSFCFLSITTTAQNTNATITAKNADTPISGAWSAVDKKEFLIMNDGFYSSVAQDSTGKWASVHAGTYTVDNANTLTFKVLHSSFAYRIGYLHTIEYDQNGENLTIKWYKKMLDANAEDITARLPKGEKTQYVRAKK